MNQKLTRRRLVASAAAAAVGVSAGTMAIRQWGGGGDGAAIGIPSPFPALASDVPSFRGDAAHTGRMPGPGPMLAPTVVWNYSLDGHAFLGGPAVAGGLVFALSATGVVHAVELATGVGRWQSPIVTPENDDATSIWPSTPVIASGRVLVTTARELFALDAATGTKLWQYGGNWTQDSSPTVVDTTVYVHADDTLRAIDVASGKERWRYHGDAALSSGSAPAVVDGVAYLGMGDAVHAVDAATGKQRWRVEAGEFIHASPTVGNGVVYVGSGTAGRTDGLFLALDAETGREQWRMMFGTAFEASPAFADATLYFVESSLEGSSELVAVDTVAVSERWRIPIGNPIGSPIVADGVVYPGGETGADSSVASRLRAFNAADGSELWQIEIGTQGGIGADLRGPLVATDGLLLGIGNYWPAALYALGNR